jgi:hypothetical protein
MNDTAYRWLLIHLHIPLYLLNPNNFHMRHCPDLIHFIVSIKMDISPAGNEPNSPWEADEAVSCHDFH